MAAARAEKPYRLMAVVAHPDDEALGLGGTLAKYASEGVDTYVLTVRSLPKSASRSCEPPHRCSAFAK
jgi:hypothetical protein